MAFLEQLKSIRLEINPNEITESSKAEMLKTLAEMESLVSSLKQRLLQEEMPAASPKA